MLTAEMRPQPQPPSVESPERAFAPAPDLFTSAWTKVGVWLLAAASLGASLAYMGADERPAAPGYALDRSWAASSPLGIDPRVEAMPPLITPTPGCAVCGQVETVSPITPAQGKRPLFEVKVRMEDGHTQTVHFERRLAVGTRVTLAHGILRIAEG